jgi:hypothetical protein
MNQNKPENYDSYRTTPRTWRSNINSRNLSLPMKRALRESLKNENKVNCTRNISNALVTRNLCSQNCILTNEGQVVALEESSLLQQTKSLFLTINILELKLARKVRPETAVLNYLLSNNHIKAGCYAEGGDIKTLLSCMCFDVICNAWRTHSLTHPLYKDYHLSYGESAVKNTIMSNTYSSPLGSIDLLDLMEYLPDISAENRPSPYKYLVNPILDAISCARKKEIKKSFTTLKKWHHNMGWPGDNWPWTDYVGLTLSFIISLYEALGNKTLYEIARTYFTDPSTFGGGWPDLTTIDHNNVVRLYEVKTTDKLLRSQIITISDMSKFFPIEIIKVKN